MEDKNMADEAIDHEARRMAQDAKHHAERALDQIAANQKVIEAGLQDAKLFEAEMRTAIKDMSEKQTQRHDRIHDEVHRVETTLSAALTDAVTQLTKAVNDGQVKVHTRINQIMLLVTGGLFGLVGKLAYDLLSNGIVK